MPQLVYTVSADTIITARRVAEHEARAHGWRNINVLTVLQAGDRVYTVTLLVS